MVKDSAILDLPPEPPAWVEICPSILTPRREEISAIMIDDSHKDPPDPPHPDHDGEPQPRDYPITPGTGRLFIAGNPINLIHSRLGSGGTNLTYVKATIVPPPIPWTPG